MELLLLIPVAFMLLGFAKIIYAYFKKFYQDVIANKAYKQLAFIGEVLRMLLINSRIAFLFAVGLFSSLFTFFFIAHHTAITTLQLALVTLGISFIVFIIFNRFFQTELNASLRESIMLSLGFVGPFLTALLLCINYFISIQELKESYKIEGSSIEVFSERRIGGKSYNSFRAYRNKVIYLENNAYEDFKEFRMVEPHEVSSTTGTIEYTFTRGLLGIKVLRSYSFK